MITNHTLKPFVHRKLTAANVDLHHYLVGKKNSMTLRITMLWMQLDSTARAHLHVAVIK